MWLGRMGERKECQSLMDEVGLAGAQRSCESQMVRGGGTASLAGANSFNNSKTLWRGNGTVAAAVLGRGDSVPFPTGPVLFFQGVALQSR